MTRLAGGRRFVAPDVRRGELTKRGFAIAAGDERQLPDPGCRPPGGADESRVVVVGDWKPRDEELADVDAMDGPLILLGVGRAHEKVAGRNARQIRRYRRAHRGARTRGGHRARSIWVVRDRQYSATPDTILTCNAGAAT